MEFFRFMAEKSLQQAAFILIMSVIQGVMAGLFPGLIIYAAADIVAGQGYMIWVFLLIGSIAIQILTYQIAESRTAVLTEQALEELILGIVDTLRRDELPEFERRNHAEIHLSLGEARAIAEAALQSVRSFQSLVTLFILWLYIFSLSMSAGILFLMLCGLILLINEASREIGRDLFLKIAGAEKRLFDVFGHFLNGFREIRINYLKNEDIFVNYLVPFIRKIKQLRYRTVYVQTDFMVCMNTAFSFLVGTVAFFLSSSGGSEVIVQLLICTLYTVKPSWTIVVAVPGITRGQASLDRLRQFAPADRHIRQSDSYVCDPREDSSRSFETLTLENIVFIYYEADGAAGFSAGPFSLTVRAGEIVFLAGGNGSGKSTFVKILTGLYPPASGRAVINGNEASLSDHRYLFSAVFSDFHLFDALYGIEEPDERQIRELLAMMGLTRKTRYADGRFTTTDLSAGQRRRLALMVALQEDRAVYVFDEWAADQDPDFRRWFYEELLPSLKKQGKTVIAVTHDDGYYHLADRLLIIKDGKISEDQHSGKEPKRKGSDPVSCVCGSRYEEERVRHDPADADNTSESHDLDTRPFHSLQIRSVAVKLGCLALADGAVSALIIDILFRAISLPSGYSDIRLIFLFALVMLADFYITRYFNLTVAETIEAFSEGFRIGIIDRIRKIGLISFEAAGAGPVFTSLTTDINSMSDASFRLAVVIRTSVKTAILTAYFAFLSFPAFMTEMFVIGGIAIVYVWNQYRIRDITEQLREREIAFYNAVSHLILGFKELRLNARKNDAFFRQSLTSLCSDLRSLRLKSARYMMTNTVLVYVAWTVLMGMLPLLFPFVSISPGDLFQCIGILCFLPINVFVLALPTVLIALTSFWRLQRTERILETAEQDIVSQAPAAERETFRELCCQDIVFRYQDRQGDHQFFVGPLNLSFRAGEIIFLTGGNGSGKSTLVKLVTGLYSPSAGQLLLNGQVTDIRRHRYLFSVIFSDFHLFDRLYGIPAPDEKKVNGLIRRMGIAEKVRFEHGKFTTTDLSAGQRKRLALVAAIMEDRPVYLFDEWAAEQDPQFRAYFYETLLPEFRDQGKAVIAVTHHDQYFHIADRVVRMDYGQAAEVTLR
ncbi:cyclic peptide export ABC transporter [Desulfonema magnum]|uniref:Cyclic peptide ABC transporter, ATP-binding protein n=1 Tax=Desulfonema magnum TaxID=45655 RepID=A0A975BJ74_9BACT|nr:cyclic peptide export ABC transporter [Desulfonema magnum]QTA86283.1 Cyclic peptide ABC transporter, ATP-binding protein [Desulfonema magnum]